MWFRHGLAPIELFRQYCTFLYSKRNISIAKLNAVSTHRPGVDIPCENIQFKVFLAIQIALNDDNINIRLRHELLCSSTKNSHPASNDEKSTIILQQKRGNITSKKPVEKYLVYEQGLWKLRESRTMYNDKLFCM